MDRPKRTAEATRARTLLAKKARITRAITFLMSKGYKVTPPEKLPEEMLYPGGPWNQNTQTQQIGSPL